MCQPVAVDACEWNLYDSLSSHTKALPLIADNDCKQRHFISRAPPLSSIAAYHKAMPVPISRHEIASVGHEADGQPAKAFVSALAWSERRELLFAANSVGAVQVLQTV